MKIKKLHIGLLLILLISGLYYASIPDTLFNEEYSTVVESESGELLGAHIAADGQWRFPASDSIPDNFRNALICFEDKRFYDHVGVDFRSIGRAVVQNIKEGRVVSGASTITMQVIRLSKNNPPRTIRAKVLEAIQATRLEWRYSKEEIINMWASHAPMGGNVVGLEAASWRYYQKSPQVLSQAEAATLAVLPNAPSLIHPGKNRSKLLQKRNRLLKRMHQEGFLDELDYELALLEEIPEAPSSLPRKAPHLTDYLSQINEGKRHRTTINSMMQEQLSEVAHAHYLTNRNSDIQNLAILVLDVHSGEVLSYIGNAPKTQEEQNVDMIRSSRSSGSVLKPLLYAAMLDDGKITPKSLRPDIPIQINGFRPSNYDKSYSGAVASDEALARSLNIPSVIMLQEYGVDRFISRLKESGFSTINKTSDHYGLSLIIGGAEVNLWELTGAYGRLARDLNNYINIDSEYIYYQDDYPSVYATNNNALDTLEYAPIYSAGAIYHTLEAMTKVSRPDSEGKWDQFYSQRPLSWKTGTSYGHRDAWAVGVNAKYVIGVWVGNADGEGKSGLVGVKKAGPLLFDVVNRLDGHRGFEKPYDDMDSLHICQRSGFLAGEQCPSPIKNLVSRSVVNSEQCPYHQLHFVNKENERVLRNCSESDFTPETFFVLPSEMAHYYQREHPEYVLLPPMTRDCQELSQDRSMALIYPQKNSSIYLPINRDGVKESAILHAAHVDQKSAIHWHLDEKYLGSTQGDHKIELQAGPGKHLLTLVDDRGETLARELEVVN